MSIKNSQSAVTNAATPSGLGARLATLKDSKKRSQITWGDASPQALCEIIENAVMEGSLVSFSRTLDGGALVLTILDGGSKTTFYAANSEELNQLVEDVHRAVND